MDITYIPMARGFVYLAVVLDWFSRRVLSWWLSITMEASFCIAALEAIFGRYEWASVAGPRGSNGASWYFVIEGGELQAPLHSHSPFPRGG
jgi:transposase InsO family protein